MSKGIIIRINWFCKLRYTHWYLILMYLISRTSHREHYPTYFVIYSVSMLTLIPWAKYLCYSNLVLWMGILVRNRPQQDASNDHVRRTVMRSVLTCDSLRLVILHVRRCINYLLIKYAWCINITTASQTIFIFVAHTHVLGSQGSRFDGVRP